MVKKLEQYANCIQLFNDITKRKLNKNILTRNWCMQQNLNHKLSYEKTRSLQNDRLLTFYRVRARVLKNKISVKITLG